MPRFEPGFDDVEEPPPEFDETTDPETSHWPPPVSGKALASLVFGAMFCIPLVPALLATLFGLMGLRETRYRARSGRGFAVVGLLLGGLGAAMWLLVLNGMASEASHAKEVAEAFLHDLSDGKVDAALARAKADTPREPLDAASRAMQDWGRFDSLAGDILPVLSRSPILRWDLDGNASFARADRDVHIRLVLDGTTYRVDRCQIAGRWAVIGSRWGDPK